MKRTWVQLFHIYQPPFQEKEILDKIVHESYELLATLHERHPNLRSTWNISGSLLELLSEHGYTELLARIRALVSRGQIEMAGTATYHPIIPLLSEKAITRQVRKHEELLAKHLGVEKSSLRTFHFPEMAWTPEAGRLVASLGYTQTILDQPHHPQPEEYKSGTVYADTSGLLVLLRNRRLSKTFPPDFFIKHPEEVPQKTLVVAHDGELYGHWHKNDYGFFGKLFHSTDVEFLTVSEYITQQQDLKKIEPITLQTASWETVPTDRNTNIPFILWDHPENIVHTSLWIGQRLCESILDRNQNDNNYQQAIENFDKGCTSCGWWWASDYMLGPEFYRTWSPKLIISSAQYLADAVRGLKNVSDTDRQQVEDWFKNLVETVWEQDKTSTPRAHLL